MGHERIGFLPRSRQWRKLVSEIGDVGTDADAVPRLAHRTLHQIRRRFDGLERDPGLEAAFSFILTLCRRGLRAPDPDRGPVIDLGRLSSPTTTSSTARTTK